VEPCETAKALNFFAIAICLFAINGLAIEVPSRYVPSYKACPLIKGKI